MILYIKNIKLRKNIKKGGIKFEKEKVFYCNSDICFYVF